MKSLLICRWVVLLGLLILISACAGVEVVEIPATGDIVTKSYDLEGFDQVEVSDFFEAEISQGEGYQVVVEAEQVLVPYLEIDVRGNRLHVGLKTGVTYNFETASQQVEVTLPTLTRAMVGNHSSLQLGGFEIEDDLRLEVDEFSTLDGVVKAAEVWIKVLNHSSLSLSGSATRVTGELQDHSTANLNRFDASEIEVETDTHSSITQ